MNDYVAWFDGACEPFNPGGTATSAVIVKGKEGTVLLEEGRLVGKGGGMSNNVAEYAARLPALSRRGRRNSLMVQAPEK